MRALRDHVLAWLQFFAAAFADPDGETTRPDPQAYRADDDARTPQGVVRAAAASFAASIEGGVLARPGSCSPE